MKKKEESITIPKKAMFGIAPAIAISVVLISRHGPGELLLFWVGISVGHFICRGFFEK